MSKAICVVLESPYRGRDEVETERNKVYMRQCMYDSLLRGEFPFLSHGLYTQVLADTNPPERALGIMGQKAWIPRADYLIVYIDLGITGGMQEGIDYAKEQGVSIKYRRLPDDRT